jgi:hypothetical protein
MKKKSIICLVLVLALACLALTACGGEKADPTLESWMAEHPEEMDEVEVEEGMEVSFEGNNLIYKYDISTLDGVTEETANSDVLIEALKDGLANEEETFKGVASDLEGETGITGISVTVIYTFGETVLVEQTFTN